MRTLSTLVIVVAGLFWLNHDCSAALFSSTKVTSMRGIQSMGVSTTLRRADTASYLGQNYVYPSDVITGASQVSVTVDTAADTARYDAISFIAPYLTPGTAMHSTNVNYQVLVTPANFPNPAVYKQVMGAYTNRVSYTSIATTAPTLVSSPMAPIAYDSGSNIFVANSLLTLTLPDVVVNGVFEAIGPMTTASKPFSIVLKPASGAKLARSYIPGGAGFGNGFSFRPFSLEVEYNAATSTIIDQVVDDVRFTAGLDYLRVNYFIPEPSSLWLLSVTITAFESLVRRYARGASPAAKY